MAVGTATGGVLAGCGGRAELQMTLFAPAGTARGALICTFLASGCCTIFIEVYSTITLKNIAGVAETHTHEVTRAVQPSPHLPTVH